MQGDKETSFERFDRPVSFDEVELEEGGLLDKIMAYIPASDQIQPWLQEHGRQLAIGLAALIILYILYWFFFGSFVSIDVKFINTEGGLIDNVSGKLQSNGATVTSFVRSIKTNVRPGDYTVQMNSQEIYDTSQPVSITVSEQGNVLPAEIVLEKKFDLEMTQFQQFPNMHAGEQRAFEIARLRNNGSRDLRIEMVLEGTNFNTIFEFIEFQPSQVYLPSNVEVPVTVNVKINENLDVKNERDGDPVAGTLRIKFLKAGNPVNKDIDFIVFPRPKLALSPSSLNLGSIDAGTSGSKNFTLKNSSNFDVENVQLSFEVTDAPENSAGEARSWISLSDSNINVKAGASESIALNVNVPSLALEDSVEGTLTARTSGWTDSIDFEFEVEPAEIDLRPSLNRTSFILDKTESGFGQETGTLTLDNRSAIELNGIEVAFEDCTQEFVFLQQPEIFPLSLMPQEKKQLGITITAPLTADIASIQYCQLTVSYADPLTGAREDLIPMSFNINLRE